MKTLLPALFICLPMIVSSQVPITEEANNVLSFNEGKVVALANAFSEDQYDWRPAEGVRSVGESLLHLAAANYFFMRASGFELPEGIDPMAMEGSIKGKANIIQAVRESYLFLLESIGNIADENLGDAVKFPFEGEFTKQSAVILAVDHCSEHLGQLIAYARMNGITPPWSQPPAEEGEKE